MKKILFQAASLIYRFNIHRLFIIQKSKTIRKINRFDFMDLFPLLFDDIHHPPLTMHHLFGYHVQLHNRPTTMKLKKYQPSIRQHSHLLTSQTQPLHFSQNHSALLTRRENETTNVGCCFCYRCLLFHIRIKLCFKYTP